MNPVVALGVTGSIGRRTLQVADRLGLEVAGMAAGGSESSIGALCNWAERYPRAKVAVARPSASSHRSLRSLLGNRYLPGEDGVLDLAASPGATVVNGIVGAAGLPASEAALSAGARLALANKESLVAGGEALMRAARAGNAELIPVDSEHSALFQCLRGERTEEVAKLILTASGGPFRGMGPEQLAEATVGQALDHPTWRMGERITIDSATLVNKGLEVIEAHHLFGIGYDQIEVVVHPQSIVHSMVEFRDGSLKAQLGPPDMGLPIQYALTYPQRLPSASPPFRLTDSPLVFHPPDRETFPALDLAYQAGREGGCAPAAYNAADEVAVEAFLSSRIPFPGICGVIAEVLDGFPPSEAETVEQVMEADRQARRLARRAVERR